MKNHYESKFTYLNHEEIRRDSHRVDCTVTEADFNTNRPNPYRINYAISDISRYFKHNKKG